MPGSTQPMSVLRSFLESKLESLFEGVFGRAFRANVQPVEIARKLVKEMDDHRSVSVSRVYVPNEYTVYLSPVDRAQFAGYEDKLCEELEDYLAEHARRERYVLVSQPRVSLDSDDDLDMGMFGIATRLARVPVEERPQRLPEPEPSATVIYRPVELPSPPATHPASDPQLPESAFLLVGQQRHRLDSDRVVIGRSKDCDIQVIDPNVSRQHAEITRSGDAYTLVDLGSTNGIEVEGRRVKEVPLEDGSRFTVGSTEVVFSREARWSPWRWRRFRSRPHSWSSRSRFSSSSTCSSGASSARRPTICDSPRSR